jgi:hypothetical protein
MKWNTKKCISVIDMVRDKGWLEAKFTVTEDRVGSKEERKYYRVMPVDVDHKLYFRNEWEYIKFRHEYYFDHATGWYEHKDTYRRQLYPPASERPEERSPSPPLPETG